MKITTIGRGEIGGTLGKLWASAGHEVTELGHDGGDASDADVVLLAAPGTVVSEALAGVSGLQGKVILDATNRIASETPPPAGLRLRRRVREGDHGRRLRREGVPPQLRRHPRPGRRRRASAEQPVGRRRGCPRRGRAAERDIGMEAAYGGPLERAAVAEAFTEIFISVRQEAGAPIFYRFATPEGI